MSLPLAKDLLKVSNSVLAPDSPVVKPYVDHMHTMMNRAADKGETQVLISLPVRFRGRPGHIDKAWDVAEPIVLKELQNKGYTVIGYTVKGDHTPGAHGEGSGPYATSRGWKISWAEEEMPKESRLGDHF